MCSTYLACEQDINGAWNGTVMTCGAPETYFYERLGECHPYCETSDSIDTECTHKGSPNQVPGGVIYCSDDWMSEVDCFHFKYCYQDFSTVKFNVRVRFIKF